MPSLLSLPTPCLIAGTLGVSWRRGTWPKFPTDRAAASRYDRGMNNRLENFSQRELVAWIRDLLFVVLEGGAEEERADAIEALRPLWAEYQRRLTKPNGLRFFSTKARV